jgi:hypothetical protein
VVKIISNSLASQENSEKKKPNSDQGVAHSALNLVHRAACDALESVERPTELLGSIADFILERQV